MEPTAVDARRQVSRAIIVKIGDPVSANRLFRGRFRHVVHLVLRADVVEILRLGFGFFVGILLCRFDALPVGAKIFFQVDASEEFPKRIERARFEVFGKIDQKFVNAIANDRGAFADDDVVTYVAHALFDKGRDFVVRGSDR